MARWGAAIAVDWCYSGFHAWFNVRVELERFVRRGDEETLQETLTEPRPARARRGGFAYTGSSTFDVWPEGHLRLPDVGKRFRVMKRY